MAYKIGSDTVINENGVIFKHQTEVADASVEGTETKITASDGGNVDYFGRGVAVGSGKIVVGAYGDDDNGTNAGAAYIYDLDGTNEVKIKPSDGAASDNFGRSVAVGSGRVVVGSYLDDDNGSSSGSAYIFDLNGTQLAKIKPSDGAASDYFGWSVAVGCNRIVVGAYRNDPYGTDSGTAYIFDLDGNQLKILYSHEIASSYEYFGESVAVGCGRIVVGARYDDDEGTEAGAAHIFDLDGNKLKKITASDGAASDYFGRSVAVGSGRIVVGAWGDDDNGSDSGSAYIFDLEGNQLEKITASDGAAGDQFGFSVSIESGRIVIGTRFDEDNGTDSGSAYIFDLEGNQLAKITSSDNAAYDFFGEKVAVGSGRIVFGAHGDKDGTIITGSAYIYDLGDSQDITFEKMLEGYGKE